jgi:hypothetical protein
MYLSNQNYAEEASSFGFQNKRAVFPGRAGLFFCDL